MASTPLQEGPLYRYQHDHPPVVNVNDLTESSVTFGQRVADRLAAVVGSWPFIIVQSFLLMLWIFANVYFAFHPGALKAFDPYPFILLNLALSFQAAYTGPIVMMSQNRQSEKDRLMAQNDYQCNQTAETEIRLLMEHLQFQDRMMQQLMDKVDLLTAETNKAKSDSASRQGID